MGMPGYLWYYYTPKSPQDRKFDWLIKNKVYQIRENNNRFSWEGLGALKEN